MEWVEAYRPARRAIRRKAVVLVAILTLASGSSAFLDAYLHSRTRHKHQELLDREVGRLERFVADARGLQFRRRVRVKLVSASQFATATGSVDRLRNFLVAVYPAFAPLGLSTGGDDPTVVASTIAYRELGVYDDQTGEIQVRASAITPFTRRILVHELTHAIDDQNFSFKTLDREYEGHDVAISALIEGDARNVEDRYVKSLSTTEQVLAGGVTLASTAHVAGVPDDVLDLVRFPYTGGVSFVDHLVRSGGEAAVDDAFMNPPVADHEILHPDFFETERKARTRFLVFPEPPKPVGRSLGVEGRSYFLGEEITKLYLEQVIEPSEARRAAAYWMGDLSTVWNNGKRDCIHVVYTRPLTAERTDTLKAALKAWATGVRTAKISDAGLGFVSCG